MRWTLSSCPRAKSGFVLITVAITIVALLGILGMCVDLSRMYITKNELQAYADAASLAAAHHLDGTSLGITNATTIAKNYPDAYNFATTKPDSVSVAFASDPAGPYVTNPASPQGIKYVQVTANGSVTLYFLPAFAKTAPLGMLWTIGGSQSMIAIATSGQFLKSNAFNTGLLPYSPYVHDPTDTTNYGFVAGRSYTLRWPPPGQENKNNACPAEVTQNFSDPSSSSSQRGFIDIGWPAGNGNGGPGGGSAFIREAIISNVQSKPLGLGDDVNFVSGNRGTESDALQERYTEDTDTTTDWQTYMTDLNNGTANGRRLGIVPINDPNSSPPGKVVAFGLFLLQNKPCGNSSVAPCCATFIGMNPILPGGTAGTSTPGVYQLKLFK